MLVFVNNSIIKHYILLEYNNCDLNGYKPLSETCNITSEEKEKCGT